MTDTAKLREVYSVLKSARCRLAQLVEDKFGSAPNYEMLKVTWLCELDAMLAKLGAMPATSALTPSPSAVGGVSDEAVTAALPHLIGVEGSKVRPLGHFIPGFTADESEDWNWCHLGRDRVRAALTAAAPFLSSPAAVADGWLPIDSAPKTGLFFGWSVGGQCNPEIIHGGTYWQSIAPDAKPYMPIDECRALTHWRPLPAAPGGSLLVAADDGVEVDPCDEMLGLSEKNGWGTK